MNKKEFEGCEQGNAFKIVQQQTHIPAPWLYTYYLCCTDMTVCQYSDNYNIFKPINITDPI